MRTLTRRETLALDHRVIDQSGEIGREAFTLWQQSQIGSLP